jgi:hypothetical protein
LRSARQASSGAVALYWRWIETARSDVEQQAGDRAEVVGELTLVRLVETKGPVAQREVLVPPPELDLRPGQRVVAAHDRSVERRHQRRVQEVQDVCGRRAQSLDLVLIETVDRVDHPVGGGATLTGVEEAGEGKLVVTVLVDVGDPHLRLPKEGVICTLEDLPLLCD